MRPSYTIHTHIQNVVSTNWLIHIHSEATTILKWLFKYKICQSYEIRNPKILRAHFAMDGTYFGNGFFMLR